MSAPTVDMTKAVPIPADFDQPAAGQNPTASAGSVPGQQTYPSQDTGTPVTQIVPKPGEEYTDTLRRAAEHGKTVTQAERNASLEGAGGKAVKIMLAAPLIGAGGAASLATTGEVGATASGIVGVGVKAAKGAAEAVNEKAIQPLIAAVQEELPYLRSAKQVELYTEYAGNKAGVLAKELVLHAIEWVKANPGEAIKLAGRSALLAATVKYLMFGGKPSPSAPAAEETATETAIP